MRLLRVGQNASFVDAINALYLEPTLDPDLTTPPGKGVIIFASFLIASIAISHASKQDFLD